MKDLALLTVVAAAAAQPYATTTAAPNYAVTTSAPGYAATTAAPYTGPDVNESSYTNIVNNTEFCPAGWHLVAGPEANMIHNSYASDHDNSNTTDQVEHHCSKCPFGQTSNGGYAPACFAASTYDGASCYRPCSHLTCKEVTVVNPCYHASVNPFAAILGPSDNAPECKYGNVQYNVSTHQVNRIAVYHHGHEQHGTQHRCRLEDADEYGNRACSCECATDPAYGGYASASCPTPAPGYVATTAAPGYVATTTAAPGYVATTTAAPGYVATTTAAPDATTTAAPDATTTAAPDATTTSAPVATTTAAPLGAVCGDGVLDAGEACDDSNTASGDGCSSLCVVEPWYSCQSASQATANPTGPYCKAWRVRRDINTLSDQEMDLYSAAVTALYEQTNDPSAGTSNYHFWVQSHLSSPISSYAHGAPGFLPWHRKYLLEYEKALRAVVVGGATPYANVMIPYFDWAEWSGDPARSSNVLSGINSEVFGNSRFGTAGNNALANTGFAPSGGFNQLYNGQPVHRGSPMTYSGSSIPTTASFIASQIPTINYGTYRQGSEQTGHNTMHCTVGGLMCSHASPGDPLFWSHHALVDKHWAVWQDCHDYDEVSTAPAATCSGLSGTDQCKLNNDGSTDSHYNSAALWDAHMPFPNSNYNTGSSGGANWGPYDSASPTASAKPATWDHGRTTVRQYMKIDDLGDDSYMYEMDDLDQQLYDLSGGGGGTQTLQCNMDWNAFSTVKALADATHSTHFASSPSDVITQAAGQSSGSLPFELDLDESTSVDCVDDPDGRLADHSLDCPAVLPLGCSHDLALSHNFFPVGTLVELVCPESCDNCWDGRTPEEVAMQCVSDEFSIAQEEATTLEEFSRESQAGMPHSEAAKSVARASKLVQDRQQLKGAMCDGSAHLNETTYLKQMKDAAFRVCSGIAAITGETFTEPTMFPGGMMNEQGVFVPNSGGMMGTPLTPAEKAELPCFGVPASDTMAAESIAMGKCTAVGACDAETRVEESWCDVEILGLEPMGKVPSGWTANNFQLQQKDVNSCNTCSCTNGAFSCVAVQCHDTPAIMRSVRMGE